MKDKTRLVDVFFGRKISSTFLREAAVEKVSSAGLMSQIDNIMSNIDRDWGIEGENDHRAAAAYELLFQARERLAAIEQNRE